MTDVRTVTPNLGLIKYSRGHPVTDTDLAMNMDVIDGVVVKSYGEGWFYDNSVALTVETVDVPIAMYGPVVGDLRDMTYTVGAAGATSAFADGTGGTVLVTSAGHPLVDGDIITIMGSTNYNGLFTVSDATTDTFKITDTWVADDGISTWIQPASIDVTKSGVYELTATISGTTSAACVLKWIPHRSTTPIVKAAVERKFANNDLASCALGALVELTAGDKVWMAVYSDSLIDITSKNGGMRIMEL